MDKLVALVTGGMGGLGVVISQKLADAGHEVAVTYNKNGDHQKAREWQQYQKSLGYNFYISYCDVTSFDSAGKAVQDIEENLGKINVLVNNAGITQDRTLKKMSIEEWQNVITTNLNSVFNLCRASINQMIGDHFGRVINIASINGQKGQVGQTNYAASKAGMHGFTMSLAQEVANKGITVNTISPGYIKTPMIENVPPDILKNIIDDIPVGRLADPSEIADLVCFLARKDSGYITGANIPINGGQFIS